MALELRRGDVVRTKKKHPCGNDLWEVTRLGADIGMVCRKCGRYVMLQRLYLERRVKAVLPREEPERESISDPGPESAPR